MRVSALVLSTAIVVTQVAHAEDAAMAKQAREVGISTCIEKVASVGNFVVNNRPHGTHDFWSKKSPNDRPYSSFVVKSYSDGNTHVSMVVGPDGSGRCFAEYNETSFWPKNCSVVREEMYGKLKYESTLNETTLMLRNDDSSMYVYMTPQSNGNACLTTKREVMFY